MIVFAIIFPFLSTMLDLNSDSIKFLLGIIFFNEPRKIALVEKINETITKTKKIKATPEYIFRNVREMIQKYKSVQFLFVKGRKEASEITKKILFSKGKCRDIDLQLAYDLKLL